MDIPGGHMGMKGRWPQSWICHGDNFEKMMRLVCETGDEALGRERKCLWVGEWVEGGWVVVLFVHMCVSVCAFSPLNRCAQLYVPCNAFSHHSCHSMHI